MPPQLSWKKFLVKCKTKLTRFNKLLKLKLEFEYVLSYEVKSPNKICILRKFFTPTQMKICLGLLTKPIFHKLNKFFYSEIGTKILLVYVRMNLNIFMLLPVAAN